MLTITLRRLAEMLPEAEVLLTNSDVKYFQASFPHIIAVSPEARAWFFTPITPERAMRRLLPSSVSFSIREAQHAIAAANPGLWSRAVKLRNSGRTFDDPSLYASALLSADAYVISGAGQFTDAFAEHAFTVLKEIRIAVRHGIPVYVFGQGIGPIADPVLKEEARQVLPTVTRICLREKRFGVPLLRELGVNSNKIEVTGDDAIELVHRSESYPVGDGIGFNLRLTAYSNLDSSSCADIGQGIRSVAKELGASLYPVPISRLASEDDLVSGYRVVLDSDPPPEMLKTLATPIEVAEQIRRCRVVVTASYHGSIFALAQGVPCVCISKSPYYDNKFLGVADQFGCGVEVVFAQDAAKQLPAAIKRMWAQVEEIRPRLLQAADRQLAASRAAYQKMADELAVRQLQSQ